MKRMRNKMYQRAPFASDAIRINRRIMVICWLGWLVLVSAVLALWVAADPVDSALAFSFPAFEMLQTPEEQPKTTEPPQTTAEIPVSIMAEAEEATTETMQTGQVAAPTILIYHTHATEAYFMTAEEPYEASGKWRTEDPDKSVIAVGERLKQLLENEYGFSVLHDTQNHEPPKLSTAYSRSLLTMQSYQERYPSIQVFIDLHRDAYGTSSDLTEPKDYIEIDGKQVARLMFVVGTGKGATGSGFSEMPDFESNFSLAQNISEQLKLIDPSLVREIRVKTGRYNQHVSNQCLLVEVGHNANTLQQALNAMPYLAKAIFGVLGETDQVHAVQTMGVWSP